MPTPSAVQGVPIGLELMGREGGDDELLDLAMRIEKVLKARRAPDLRAIEV